MAERTPIAPTLATRLAALGREPRLAILAEPDGGAPPVSELARRVVMSRELPYLHLAELEQAGFVQGPRVRGRWCSSTGLRTSV